MSTSHYLNSPQSSSHSRPQTLTKTTKQQQQQQSNISYIQPFGSSQRSGTGSDSGVRPASWSEPSRKGKSVVRAVGGRRRNIHCDVIVEGVDRMEDGTWTLPEAYQDCIYSLGTPFEAAETVITSTISQPPTTKKVPSVDQAKVRQHLRELWSTEENYLRKIRSLYQDFALPLRAFAGDVRTAVIPKFEAKVLFSNIEEIVPIAEAFVLDLRELIEELNSNSEILPMRFGEVILHHVQKMVPFKRWLASVTQSESIYQSLIKSNSAFKTFIETAQIVSRERAQTTSGFKEFLAEPFQRVSRYRLMIDPMIRHLSVTDGNVDPLEQAVELLTDICSMRVDEESRRAAAMWSLMTTIEGFPPAMIHFDRHFIDCIDVNEIVDSSSSSTPNILKCTLYLFTDKILIAKRPSGDKGGRQHAGLDNIDNLVQLYSTSNLTNVQNNLLGSPKKLKKDVMGFRGVVDIMEVVGIDFGEHYMGLVFDNPPLVQSERWSGRSARRFEVASTYPSDMRQVEKNTFLNHLAERQCLIKSGKGALTMKSVAISLGGGELEDETIVFWSIWQREMWEREIGGRLRTHIALQLDEDGEADDLDYGFDGKPSIVARATLLENPEMCRFSARTRNRAMRSTENIQLDRIPRAIAEIGAASGHFDFPQNRPSTPSGSIRSRPRSLLLSASSALDIFSGGSASLKRTLSTASRSSNATTASHTSWGGSSVGSMTPSMGSLSPNPNAAAKFFKKNSPNWYSGSPASKSVSQLDDGRYDDDEDDGDTTLEVLKLRAGESPIDDRRRRYSSLPPPSQPRFESVSPRPQEVSEASCKRDVELQSTATLLSHSASQVFSPTVPRGQMSLLSPTTNLPLPTQHPLTSPVRRRIMGPRDIGSSAPSSNHHFSISPMGSSSSSSMCDPRTSSNLSSSQISPQISPFERNDTPPPPPPMQGVERSNTLPLSLTPRGNSNNSASKRSLNDASPRASPAKKLAPLAITSSLGEPLSRTQSKSPSSSNERNAGGEGGGGSPNELRVRVPSGSVYKGRNSGESIRRNRRNGSEVSTLRGNSPPLVTIPDLSIENKSRVDHVMVKEEVAEEVQMEDVNIDDQEAPKEIIAVADSNSTPAEKLKVHIWQLRNKLNLESVSKENDKSNSSGLSRSPHTRNVFAQSTNTLTAPINPSNSLRRTIHESKNSLDLTSLNKWADRLNELVDHFTDTLPSAETKVITVEVEVPVKVEVEVPTGISREDFEKVMEERDLARLELEELRLEMELLKSRPEPIEVATSESDLVAQVEALTKLNATLKSQYDEMTESIEEMYSNFDEDLAEARLESFEEELTTIFSVVRSGAEHDLAGALHTAVKEKKRLELEVESLKMRISAE